MNSLISQAISIAPDIQLIPEILVTPEIEVVDRHVHSIKELLRLTNVERLIYVDDKFDVVQRENEFLGLVKSKKNTGAEFDFIPDIDMIPDPVFEAKMKELWAHSTDRERISFLDGLETKDENTVPIGILNKYFSEVLTTLSPQKWVETKDNLLADIQGDNKVLCLFDSDLGAGERSGQDLARTILTGEHKHKIYCGIFSHIFQPEDENQIRLTYEIDKELFYPISKHRLQSDQGLAGFSQGGMLISDAFMRHPERLRVTGLALFSTSRIAVDEWPAPESCVAARGLPVLLSHGRADADLAFAAGEGLRDVFVRAGAAVTFLPFDQGHEIPLVVWRGFRRFLLKHVP